MKPLGSVGGVHVILIAVSLITGTVVNVTSATTTGIVTRFGELDTKNQYNYTVMAINYGQV